MKTTGEPETDDFLKNGQIDWGAFNAAHNNWQAAQTNVPPPPSTVSTSGAPGYGPGSAGQLNNLTTAVVNNTSIPAAAAATGPATTVNSNLLPATSPATATPAATTVDPSTLVQGLTPAAFTALANAMSLAAAGAVEQSKLRGIVMRPVFSSDGSGRWTYEPVTDATHPNGIPTAESGLTAADIAYKAALTAAALAGATGRIQDPEHPGQWIDTPAALHEKAMAELAKAQAHSADADAAYTAGVKTDLAKAQIQDLKDRTGIEVGKLMGIYNGMPTMDAIKLLSDATADPNKIVSAANLLRYYGAPRGGQLPESYRNLLTPTMESLGIGVGANTNTNAATNANTAGGAATNAAANTTANTAAASGAAAADAGGGAPPAGSAASSGAAYQTNAAAPAAAAAGGANTAANTATTTTTTAAGAPATQAAANTANAAGAAAAPAAQAAAAAAFDANAFVGEDALTALGGGFSKEHDPAYVRDVLQKFIANWTNPNLPAIFKNAATDAKVAAVRAALTKLDAAYPVTMTTTAPASFTLSPELRAFTAGKQLPQFGQVPGEGQTVTLDQLRQNGAWNVHQAPAAYNNLSPTGKTELGAINLAVTGQRPEDFQNDLFKQLPAGQNRAYGAAYSF